MRRIRAFEDWEGYETEERARIELMNGRTNKIANNIEELFKTIFNKRYGNKVKCFSDNSGYWRIVIDFYESSNPSEHETKSILSFDIHHKSDSDTIYIYLKDGAEFFGFFDSILDQTASETSSAWCYYWIPFNKTNDGDAKVNRINYQEYKTYLAKEKGKRFDL